VYVWRARRPHFGKYLKRQSPPVQPASTSRRAVPNAAVSLSSKKQGETPAKSSDYSQGWSPPSIGRPNGAGSRNATRNDHTTKRGGLMSTQSPQTIPPIRQRLPAPPPTPPPFKSTNVPMSMIEGTKCPIPSAPSSIPFPSEQPRPYNFPLPSTHVGSIAHQSKENQPIPERHSEAATFSEPDKTNLAENSSYHDTLPTRNPKVELKPHTLEGPTSAPRGSIGPTNFPNTTPTKASIPKRLLSPSSGYYLSASDREELAREHRAEREARTYWELMRYD